MTTLTALGKTVFYDEKTAAFSFGKSAQSESGPLLPIPSIDKILAATKPTAYTFCIDVSDACNLRCDYCFNKLKTGKTIDSRKAFLFLERMFEKYPTGEKYFVDMSGKGEPLLALSTVLEIADWCKRKQDQIRREIVPQFVCNGTLLTPMVAAVLQDKGILFGVSLDGDRETHDKHRRDALGGPTYERIIKNIQGITFRDYVGCATTMTKDVFPLVETIDSLLPLFKTVCFRPARGTHGFDQTSEALWELEYERLGYRLLGDMRKGDPTVFLALMNGEDYFGRYLVRAIGSKRAITRCDASIARFALDIDGNEYPCPACTEIQHLSLEAFSLRSQALRCNECPLKYICGGECPLLFASGNTTHEIMCKFRKKLIAISMVLAETMRFQNYSLFQYLERFCDEKAQRLRKDLELSDYMLKHPELSFTQAKKAFDEKKRRY